MKNKSGRNYLRVARLAELIGEVRARWPEAMLIADEDDEDGGISIFVKGETTTEGDYVGRIEFKGAGRVVPE